MQQWQKYAAEVFGTMILVGVGTGAILATLATDTPVQAAIPLGFGLALLAALYAVGEVSGGHFNPAVSLAIFLNRAMTLTDLIGYWIAQFAGAILGSAFVAYLTSRGAVGTFTTTNPASGLSDVEAFVAEVIFTTVFVWVIFGVVKGHHLPRQAFLAVSLVLAGIHYIGVPLTGASVNPARSFAPFVVGEDVLDRGSIWIYLLAPLVGAVIGWGLYKVVNEGDTDFRDDVAGLRDHVSE